MSTPSRTPGTICEFLNTLTALDDLQLDIQGAVDVSSLQVHGLRKFTLKSPRWESQFDFGWMPPTPEPIMVPTHDKLNEITTNVVTPELFNNLSSYYGIEKLVLLYPDGGSRNDSDRLADTFFETDLPRHATSLVELSCSAGYKSRFSFGTHNVDVISLLHNLKYLEMSINAGISVEAEKADIDPIVMLLLETVATLPALRGLTINSAETESNRGAW
ncbi:hypothetical protein B0H14DRAFT_3487792 [Mycena olivaceomarginata]|nr:hypothetical protein B0H14DRAFT_3487792 [Mycena olivaceomarginata]